MRWWKISQFEYEHRRRAAINIGAQVRLPHRPCLWLPKVCSNWFARSSNMINPFSWTIITLCARTHGVYATRNGAKRNAPSFISINVITSRRVAAFHHWWLHFGQSKCNLIVVRVSTRLSLPYRFFPQPTASFIVFLTLHSVFFYEISPQSGGIILIDWVRDRGGAYKYI